jgi:hypothetical protein
MPLRSKELWAIKGRPELLRALCRGTWSRESLISDEFGRARPDEGRCDGAESKGASFRRRVERRGRKERSGQCLCHGFFEKLLRVGR